MRSSIYIFSLIAVVLASGVAARGEEKNGLSLTVSKTTVDRADQRAGAFAYSTHIDRTEALKLAIKNTSFKAIPEGDVKWEILVRKYLSTTIESTSGKEKLQALKPAESAEVIIGGAQIEGWRDGTNMYKDKIEWQVSIMVEGKELIKLNSTSAFDTLAKRATKITPKAGREVGLAFRLFRTPVLGQVWFGVAQDLEHSFPIRRRKARPLRTGVLSGQDIVEALEEIGVHRLRHRVEGRVVNEERAGILEEAGPQIEVPEAATLLVARSHFLKIRSVARCSRHGFGEAGLLGHQEIAQECGFLFLQVANVLITIEHDPGLVVQARDVVVHLGLVFEDHEGHHVAARVPDMG